MDINDADVEAGQAMYTRRTLQVYDLVVGDFQPALVEVPYPTPATALQRTSEAADEPRRGAVRFHHSAGRPAPRLVRPAIDEYL
jgi:hypothetical protein